MLNNKKHKAFLMTEMWVGLVVLSILLTAFAVSLYHFKKFNHYQLLRQQCTAAAQAQLDSMATTGKPLSDEDFKRLWPLLSVAIEQTDGTGQWKGLKLIKAQTQGKSMNWNVKVELGRYILSEKEK